MITTTQIALDIMPDDLALAIEAVRTQKLTVDVLAEVSANDLEQQEFLQKGLALGRVLEALEAAVRSG